MEQKIRASQGHSVQVDVAWAPPPGFSMTLDSNGWALVSDLIECSKDAEVELNGELIRDIVRSCDKQRFALSDDGTRIRASQGHSVEVDLALDPKQPPEILFQAPQAGSSKRSGRKGSSR